MTAGSLLASLLVLAWSRVSTLLELYLVFAGLGVAMALVLYEPAFIVITKWFHVRRNAALTTLTLIAAFSSFVFSPLTAWLVHAYGWRDAVAVLGVILAATTVPLHAGVLRSAPPAIAPSGSSIPALSRRSVMSRASFWMITGSFVLSSFATLAITVHLVPLLLGEGRSPSFAAFVAGLMGLSQIPGRLVFGLFSRIAGVAASAAGVFLLAAASLAFLAMENARWAIVGFVVFYGMSNGMATLLRATLVGDLYGRASYGAISGIVSAFVLGARAVAPLGGALLALAPGGYTTMLLSLAIVSGVAAVAIARGARREAANIPAAGAFVVS
jgi:predicted MFS family arabinose efflux permease